jgi:hypothetical protein
LESVVFFSKKGNGPTFAMASAGRQAKGFFTLSGLHLDPFSTIFSVLFQKIINCFETNGIQD